jgi:hypothetical protein
MKHHNLFFLLISVFSLSSHTVHSMSHKNQELALALRQGKIADAEKLLEQDHWLTIESEYKNRSMLHWAVKGGIQEAVEFVLNHGAFHSPQDQNSITPLHLAIKKGKTSIARCLINAGANPLPIALIKGKSFNPLELALDRIEKLQAQSAQAESSLAYTQAQKTQADLNTEQLSHELIKAQMAIKNLHLQLNLEKNQTSQSEVNDPSRNLDPSPESINPMRYRAQISESNVSRR